MKNRITPVVKWLLIINTAMLLLTLILERYGIDLFKIFGLFYPKSEYYSPYQFFTHMFMHAGFIHLIFNMYALYLFGVILERVWGSERFLFYYLFAGLGAAALQTLVNWLMLHGFYNAVQQFMIDPTVQNFSYLVQHYPRYFDVNKARAVIANWNAIDVNAIREQVNTILQQRINIPTVGASGAIFGLLMAFGFMFPNVPLMLIFVPIPIKAKWFVTGYGLLELISGVSNVQGDHIAHFAHLGGMIFGYILLKIWYKKNWRNPKNYS